MEEKNESSSRSADAFLKHEILSSCHSWQTRPVPFTQRTTFVSTLLDCTKNFCVFMGNLKMPRYTECSLKFSSLVLYYEHCYFILFQDQTYILQTYPCFL